MIALLYSIMVSYERFLYMNTDPQCYQVLSTHTWCSYEPCPLASLSPACVIYTLSPRPRPPLPYHNRCWQRSGSQLNHAKKSLPKPQLGNAARRGRGGLAAAAERCLRAHSEAGSGWQSSGDLWCLLAVRSAASCRGTMPGLLAPISGCCEAEASIF